VVRQGRQALPAGRLHQLPGRGLRQAAARRGDPQRDQRGQIPGPRYLAASQEITVPGGLGDETLPHLPFPEFSFGVNVNGAEDMRKVVRMFLKYGVDSIKLNLSGDNFVPGAGSHTTWMTDAEVAVAAEEVKMRGKRIIVHARSVPASSRRCATAST
jgi:imidazolonepropionase-like amidohydrolase